MKIVKMKDSSMITDFGDLGETEAELIAAGRFDSTYNEFVTATPTYPADPTAFRAAEWAYRAKSYCWGASTNSFVQIAPRVHVGEVNPVGSVTGAPGDTYTRVGGTSSRIYQHRGTSANNTDWVEIGDVLAPGGASDEAIVRWNGTSGRSVMNTPVLINDTGNIYYPSPDTVSPIGVETTGANGAATRFFVGNRDPVGSVTGAPGDTYTRVGGTSSRIYQHRGTSANNTDWVELGAGGGGPYTHGVKTRSEMIAISGPAAGDTVFCSTYSRPFWWSGTVWLCDQTIEVTNGSGGTLDEGNTCMALATADMSVKKWGATYLGEFVGVIVIGGADGAQVTMATSGVWPVLVNGSATPGNFIKGSTTQGAVIDTVTREEGCMGIVLEANISGLVLKKCQIGQLAELLT
jgi:hypothetical protein